MRSFSRISRMPTNDLLSIKIRRRRRRSLCRRGQSVDEVLSAYELQRSRAMCLDFSRPREPTLPAPGLPSRPPTPQSSPPNHHHPTSVTITTTTAPITITTARTKVGWNSAREAGTDELVRLTNYDFALHIADNA